LGSSSYVLTVYKDSATFPLSAFLVKTFFCRFSSRISTCWNPSSLATTVNFWGQKIITLENENHRLKAKLEALRGRWLWKSLGDVNAAGAASGKQEPAAAAAHSFIWIVWMFNFDILFGVNALFQSSFERCRSAVPSVPTCNSLGFLRWCQMALLSVEASEIMSNKFKRHNNNKSELLRFPLFPLFPLFPKP
jgi:hypothetical protein